MNPTSSSNGNTLIVLSAIDLLGYALSTSAHHANPRQLARSPSLAGENFAKAALRAAGKVTICVRRSPRSPRSSPTEPNSLAGTLSALQVIVCTELLRTGIARPLGLEPDRRLPSGEEASVASSNTSSNQPGGRAQLCSHRSATGATSLQIGSSFLEPVSVGPPAQALPARRASSAHPHRAPR